MILLEMLSYPFLVRAMVVGVLVSLCAALLGVPLVLKRYSMIGDGLSHVGFGALAIAAALNIAPLYLAVPVVVVAAVLLLRVSSGSRIKGDAAVALISSGALAVGVLVISLTSGVNTNVSNYMFGSILSVGRSDAWLSAILCAGVIAAFVLLYPRLFAVTFDENFARATGASASAYNTLLAVLTAVTIVLGMRMMGALLISSLVIFPALSAMRVCRTFKSVTVCAAVLSVVCFLVGMTASYALETPSGASVVAVDIIAFVLCSVYARISEYIHKD
jgi:zinc transport system permease protein